MSDENQQNLNTQQQAPAPAPTTAPRQAPYVRARNAHRTVEPINDVEADEDAKSFSHDSDFVTGSGMRPNSYRRSRAKGTQLRRDLHYGQYLEIPKGRRDIFVKRERQARIRSVIACVVVLVVIALVVFFVWQYMQTNWGATS